MQFIAVIQAWAQAHPALVVLLWPLATALVNIVFGEAEKYAETHPRFHAVLAFLEASGLDVRGVVAAIGKLFGAPPPADGGGGGYRDNAKPAEEKKDEPAQRSMLGLALASALALVFPALIAVSPALQSGCNPAVTQQVVNTIPPAASCVLHIIDAATTGTVDIAAIIKDCGTTAEDIIAIVSQALEHEAGVADGAAGAHNEANLREALQKAYEYKAGHK